MEINIEEKLNKHVNAIYGRDIDTIKCSNCKRELMFFTQQKYNKALKYSVKVKCCSCEDYSFIYEIFGQLSLLPCDGVQVIDLQQNDSSNTVIFITKEKK